MMAQCTFLAKDEDGTRRLGAALAAALPNGAVIALIGTLGAGKTRLVQAVAEASGINIRDVVSPTFVVVNEYQGQRSIYHFDAYRLKDDDEFLELGPEEYFEGQGLTFVEWADRVERCMPREMLKIIISVTAETARHFTISANGTAYVAAVDRLQSSLT
ncbi:MAG: tRNA (adenosine(37)-N6)-threonylcarbamoyltransferase complex ATPase subunit type 1 TsaE [Planctomycetota bacterium]|nr:tRNA (adenosine(37)-N6)-threonylcarbamoyltransferase complex ATPase subunit type 1 TsaE [Planctomycetota bacterium]